VRAVVVAVFGVLALSGCTVTIDATPVPVAGAVTTPATTTPPKSTTTTPSTPYLTETPVLELNDQATKPGARLKFGEQAVVPFFSRYAKGMLGISVAVESVEAPDADIDKLPLKEEDKAKLRGKQFFFVKQTLTNIDGTNFAEIQAPILSATTRSGGFPGSLLGLARIEVTGCVEQSFAPTDFATKGATFQTCRLQFGVASDPVTSIAYTNQPYERSSTRAVTWRA
jgi:hypothetical protein